MGEIRVALAAGTVLYTPVYLVAMRKLMPNHTVTLLSLGENIGDDEAYKRLGTEAEICICDPMVCVTRSPNEKPNGKVVAQLVHKMGLWGLSTCHTALSLTPRVSPFTHQLDPEEQKINRVVTYTNASTAGRLMNYIKSHRLPNVTIKEVEFGTELTYIIQKPAANEQAVDMVVTCDLVGALAVDNQQVELQMEASSNGSGVHAKLPTLVTELCTDEGGFGEALFTAVIASNEFLKTRNSALKEFLESLHAAITSFYAASPGQIRDIATDLNGLRPPICSSVGEGSRAIIKANNDRRVAYIIKALDYLRKNELIATELLPSYEAWSRIYDVWGFDQKGKKQSFKDHTDLQPAKSACPGPRVATLRSVTRSLARPVGSVVAAWGLIAATAGQFGFTGLRESLFVFGLSLIAGALAWIFQEVVLDHG